MQVPGLVLVEVAAEQAALLEQVRALAARA
jgi:hypothetical protein